MYITYNGNGTMEMEVHNIELIERMKHDAQFCKKLDYLQ